MELVGPLGLAIAGFVIGLAVGFATRRARLCTFGALEDAFVGHDTRRLKVFGLALGVAIAGAQTLILVGILDPLQTTYIGPALPWFGVIVGGVLFGLGMALVGTCPFGTIVRLGGGDLRSFVVLLVFGLFAFATLRGSFANARIDAVETIAVALPPPSRSDVTGLLDPLFRIESRLWAAIFFASALIAVAALDRRLRRTPRLVIGGLVLGLGVTAGWAATTLLADEFIKPTMPQSLTFVSPIAIAMFGFLSNLDSFLDFGVGSLFGVLTGSLLSALSSNEFRWEAFDDPREMKRHVLGAVLMGVGGVTCGGCTIGQGLTAGSLMALSWPFAVIGMALGARLGIAALIGGTDPISRWFPSLFGARRARKRKPRLACPTPPPRRDTDPSHPV